MTALVDALVPFGSALAGACAGGFISYRLAVRAERAHEAARAAARDDQVADAQRELQIAGLLEVDALVFASVASVRDTMLAEAAYRKWNDPREAFAEIGASRRRINLAGRSELDRALLISWSLPKEITDAVERVQAARDLWADGAGRGEGTFDAFEHAAGILTTEIRRQAKALVSRPTTRT